ncbi:MAG: glycoside hydrolase domain-containing protein [Kiritimatiellales bacterium]
MPEKKLFYFLFTAGAVFFTTSGESLYQTNETFHAEYLQQQIHAAHAAGSTQAVVLHQSTATFDINPVTKKNEGLKVGNGCASLSYQTVGNLPSTAGSIEIRFKPVDWDAAVSEDYMIFQTTTDTKLVIYKRTVNGIAVHFTINDSPAPVFLYRSITNWQNHIFHHLVFTYDAAGDAVLYIDGIETGRAEIGTPADPANIVWPSQFSVGPAGSWGRDTGQTAIERVRIYDAVLTSDQVQYLAAQTEFNRLSGTFSKWFESGRPKLGLAALDKDTVLPPWTAVSWTNGTASCWNRNYNFSGTQFLGNLIAGTNSLLHEPMLLRIAVDQQAGVLSFSEPVITDQGQGRICFSRTGSFGNTTASVSYTFEYDGLLWCDLTLNIPDGSALTALSLETVVEKESAQLMHYTGAPQTYTSQNIPGNSYSKMIPADAGTHHLSGLKTMMWIGNNHHGFLWCTESDQYWWPKDQGNCLSVIRDADETVLFKIDMVSGALPANAPSTITYSFGLMATPVKPLPDGWRAWTHTDQAIGRKGDLRGINVFYWPSEYRFMMLDQDPSRYLNIESTRTRISSDLTNPERRYILPYWTRTNIHDEYEEAIGGGNTNVVTKVLTEAPLITREWATFPQASGTIRMSAATEWSDYLAWSLEEFVNVMGHADGTYIDEVQPIPNTRAESGGGYDALDGTRRPTFEIFGSRNLFKRMTYNTWQRNHERPRATAHCSATQSAHSLSAFDLWLIGEQYNSGYFWQNPELKPPAGDPVEEIYYYNYALPMDRVRAECFPDQWGTVIVWLPQLKNQPNIITNVASTRDMLSRVLQADVVIWPLWCNSAEIHKTWTWRKAFDIGNTDISFHPYWEQTLITMSGSDTGAGTNLIAGYYQKPDGDLLAIISNLNRTSQTVRVTFNNYPIANVIDAETKTEIPIDADNMVILNILRNDFSVLQITADKSAAPVSSFLFYINSHPAE